MTAHATLNASSADRWLHCPPSVRLTEGLPDASSSFAEEGTLAHAIAESALHYYKDNGKLDGYKVPTAMRKHPFFYESMLDDVMPYIEYVVDTLEAKDKAAFLEIESRLDFSEWVPEGFGTGDAVIACNDTLEIIDLKFGKGKVVDAEENPQIMLYGLGALVANAYIYDIEKVRMTIVQPRLDHITTYTLSADALTDWANTVVRPLAQLAFAGQGVTSAGKWCQWCKIRSTCRVRAEALMQVADKRQKAVLTDSELSEVLSKASEIKAWLDGVEEAVTQRLMDGEAISGWKLVEGRSNRKIKDAEALEVVLTKDYAPQEVLKPQELLPLTALEKLIGKKKFMENYGDFIYKPKGKPTLVPESDKRPALGSPEADFNFED